MLQVGTLGQIARQIEQGDGFAAARQTLDGGQGHVFALYLVADLDLLFIAGIDSRNRNLFVVG